MKQIKYILLAVILSLAIPIIAEAQYKISERDIEEIRTTMTNPLKVYSLNLQVNKKIFENIDIWIKGKDGFLLKKSEPLKRSYTKDYKVISKIEMPKEDVKGIGLKLISSNNFIQITNEDKISDSKAFSLTRQKIDSIKSDKEIILQRAIFKRSVNGFEVENSKFIVDISPQNKSIIAIKSFNWTPLNEKSETWKYKSKDQLVFEIDSVLGKKLDTYNIGKKEVKYFQTGKFLIPILKIHMIPKNEDDLKLIIVNYIFSFVADDKRLDKPIKKEMILPEKHE